MAAEMAAKKIAEVTAKKIEAVLKLETAKKSFRLG